MYKLLVVDDEVATRTTLCNYFPWEEIGFTIVAQKDDGVQALEYLKNYPVDVLLCDINMPNMDGLTLIKTIKELDIHPFIVILTGMDDVSYARQAIQIGSVNDYLIKPTKYKEFADVFTKIKSELDSLQNDKSDTSVEEKTKGRNQKIIDMVKEYIHANFKHATLTEAAGLVFMNQNYLSQFFRQECGVSFSEYLIEVKMQEATKLLRDIRYSISEISDMIGYSSPRNFTRAFKGYYDTTPKLYRDSGDITGGQT